MTEIGIYTFAEMTATGSTVGPAERLRDLLEEIELADQVAPAVRRATAAAKAATARIAPMEALRGE